MATIPNPTRPAPAARYDAVVESQLGRARGRIRLLDTLNALLGFLVITLVYGLGATLGDHWFDLGAWPRFLGLLGYGLVAAGYLGLTLVRPWLRQVNPYYAARQVEQALPGTKNSIVNYLDLREEPLPAAIRQAVVQKAARDLGHADLDQAISGRSALLLGGGVAGLFLVVCMAMMMLGPPRFFARLARAFAPFGAGEVATVTHLTILRPEGGNVTIPSGRAARFVVRVEGRVPDRQQPDAVRLCFRYGADEPAYQERLFDRDSDQDWSTSLSDTEIQDGFLYKVKAGDTETPEYRVIVRPGPLAEPVRAVYQYRPYLRPRSRTVEKPTSLEGLRGTQVTLEAHANRPAREAHLELEMGGQRQTIPGEVNPAEPERLVFKFVLDQDGKQPVQNGKVSIWFTTHEGEATSDPPRLDVSVRRDEPPVATLTQPEQDISLPANGLLQVKGSASDDIGIRDLRLRMEIVNGPKLQALPYRPEKSFRFDDGSYPRMLEYEDHAELAKVKDADGQPRRLQAGMEIEYWIEAGDCCDYPEPLNGQVGASEHRKVKIIEPARDQQKQDKQRRQSEQQRQEHQKEQDDQLRQENQQHQDQQGGAQGKGEKQPPKQENQAGQKGANEQGKGQGEGQKQEGDEKGRDANLEKNVQDALDRKNPKSADKGAGEQQKPGEPKGAGDPGPQPDKGEAKGNSDRQPQPDAGRDKGGDPQGQPQGQPGQGKDQGEGGNEKPPGAAAKAQPQPGNDAGQGKGAGEPQQKPETAETKGQGQAPGQQGQPPAEDKGPGPGAPQDGAEKAQAKGNGPGSAADQRQPAAQAKGNPEPTPAAAKDGKQPDRGPDAAAGKGATKPEGADGPAEPKPAPAEPAAGSGTPRAEKKDEGTRPGQGSGDGPDPRAEQLADHMKQHVEGNEQQRQEAERKLDELSKKSDDPAMRRAAAKLLDDLRKMSPQEREELRKLMANEDKGSAKQPPPQGNDPGASEAKGNKGEKEPAAGNAKEQGPGDPAGPQGDAKGQGKPDGQGPDGKPDGKEAPGAGKGPGQGKPGKTPPSNSGNGVAGSPDHPERPPQDNRPKEPDGPGRHREAGILQLQEFKTWVDKDVLKDARVDPDKWRRYLEERERLLRDPQTKKDAPEEKGPAIQQKGTLPDLRVDKQQGTGKTGSALGGTPGQAPPGYRDGEQDYATRRANLGKQKD